MATNKSRAVTTWQDFQTELKNREQDFANMLPQHVSPRKLISSAVAAVKQNPALLKCDARSLFNAITKAAQDGLMPDGREGVITPYGAEAQWNPMAHGLRKRARELDDIIINAQVVHQQDEFDYAQGDEPYLVHKPMALGDDRGEMIGAYAIFKNEKEGILHREVMSAAEIETVRSQSKAPNSLMWTKFPSEGWRKTVLRRGIKSVPCSPSLEQIVRRDEEAFDFDETSIEITKPKRQRQAPDVVQPASKGSRSLPPKVGSNQRDDDIDVDVDDDNADDQTADQTADQDGDDAQTKDASDEPSDEGDQGDLIDEGDEGDEGDDGVEELSDDDSKADKKPAAKKKSAKKTTTKKKAAEKKTTSKPSSQVQAEASRSPEEMFEEMENVFSGIHDQEEFEKQRKYYLDHPALQFPPDKAEAKKIISKAEEALTG